MIALVVLAAALFCVWLPKEARMRFALVAFGSLPVAWLLARAAGMLFGHEQPFAVLGFEPLVPHDVDNSFPSDHTALGFALGGSVFFYHRAAGMVLIVATMLVGASRVAAGLHYPVDIVVGAIIGIVAACGARVVICRFVQ